MPVQSADSLRQRPRAPALLFIPLFLAALLTALGAGAGLLCLAPEPVKVGDYLVAGPRSRDHWTAMQMRLTGADGRSRTLGPFMIYRDPSRVPIYW